MAAWQNAAGWPEIAAPTAAVSAPAAEWACLSCTLLNAGHLVLCGICGSNRNGSTAAVNDFGTDDADDDMPPLLEEGPENVSAKTAQFCFAAVPGEEAAMLDWSR